MSRLHKPHKPQSFTTQERHLGWEVLGGEIDWDGVLLLFEERLANELQHVTPEWTMCAMLSIPSRTGGVRQWHAPCTVCMLITYQDCKACACVSTQPRCPYTFGNEGSTRSSARNKSYSLQSWRLDSWDSYLVLSCAHGMLSIVLARACTPAEDGGARRQKGRQAGWTRKAGSVWFPSAPLACVPRTLLRPTTFATPPLRSNCANLFFASLWPSPAWSLTNRQIS